MIKKIFRIVTLRPIAIKFPILFLIVSTIIGFYIRVINGGWLLLIFLWVYLIIIGYDILLIILMMLLPYARGKKFSEEVYTNVWRYSWFQFLALILTIDGGDSSGGITWIPYGFWTFTGSFIHNNFFILFYILHLIQFTIALMILTQLKKEKKNIINVQ